MPEKRRHRIKRIRKRVAVAALAVFALAFGLIAETGSMGASAGATASKASSSKRSATHASSSEGSSQSQDSAPAVTTQQS